MLIPVAGTQAIMAHGVNREAKQDILPITFAAVQTRWMLRSVGLCPPSGPNGTSAR